MIHGTETPISPDRHMAHGVLAYHHKAGRLTNRDDDRQWAIDTMTSAIAWVSRKHTEWFWRGLPSEPYVWPVDRRKIDKPYE